MHLVLLSSILQKPLFIIRKVNNLALLSFLQKKKNMQFIFLFPTVLTLGHKISSKLLDGRKDIRGHSLSLQSKLNSLLFKMWKWETYVVVQWLRLCLPMQEVGV